MDRILIEKGILEMIQYALRNNHIQSTIRGPHLEDDNYHPYLIIGHGTAKISAWFDDNIQEIYIYSQATKLYTINIADPDSIIKLARALVELAIRI